MKEVMFIERKDLREESINRVDVLEKVKELILLPNTELATTNQVAEYYKVGISAVKSLVYDNKNEIESDGYAIWNANKFISSSEELIKISKHRGYFEVDFGNGENQKFAPRGVSLFPKRAILRVGMLLRDSEIAKEVRTRLLDIVHDTEKENPKIIENITQEIDNEKRLMLDRVEAEMNGDYDKVCEVNAQLFALKNKRIKELEVENKNITTNSLTIVESRSVINRIVRSIAINEYGSMFSKTWGEFYSKLNYKLGINIKARNKKKNESYLNTLTEEETFNTEKIVRSWAIEVGLNLEELLKIA